MSSKKNDHFWSLVAMHARRIRREKPGLSPAQVRGEAVNAVLETAYLSESYDRHEFQEGEQHGN